MHTRRVDGQRQITWQFFRRIKDKCKPTPGLDRDVQLRHLRSGVGARTRGVDDGIGVDFFAPKPEQRPLFGFYRGLCLSLRCE